MAKSPALVSAVAEVLFENPKTVKVALRRLQDEDLIIPGGKGRAGRDMTPADAVTLLLGVANSETLKEAPATVRKYSRLERQMPSRFDIIERVLGPDNLKNRYALKEDFYGKLFFHHLPAFSNFGTVLETIFSKAADGTLFPDPDPADFANPDFPSLRPDFRCERVLNVRLYGPASFPAAAIDIQFNKQFRNQLLFGELEILHMDGVGFGRAGLPVARYFETRQIPISAIERIAESVRLPAS